MTKQQFHNLWSSYRWMFRKCGSRTEALAWIASFSEVGAADAELLASLTA